jgi:hypothetical protein
MVYLIAGIIKHTLLTKTIELKSLEDYFTPRT